MKATYNQDIRDFINENKNLFWYIPEDKKEDVSLEFLLENILNYGSLESIKKLFELIGIKKANEIFRNQIENERNNYFPPVRNFFDLYFQRNA